MVDLTLIFRVFLVACTSISKAALIIAAGALLARRGVLTSDVRQGMSHMAAGLLVPCPPMLTRASSGPASVLCVYPPPVRRARVAGQLALARHHCTHAYQPRGFVRPRVRYRTRWYSTPRHAYRVHHRCLLFDRVSAHVTWTVLGEAWPILLLGLGPSCC